MSLWQSQYKRPSHSNSRSVPPIDRKPRYLIMNQIFKFCFTVIVFNVTVMIFCLIRLLQASSNLVYFINCQKETKNLTLTLLKIAVYKFDRYNFSRKIITLYIHKTCHPRLIYYIRLMSSKLNKKRFFFSLSYF